MIRFALSARTSTDDLQDPADSLRWQTDTAARLVAPHGEIVTTYHDIDKSRSLPWERRPEASRILRDLKNPNRVWDALVIAEPQRSLLGHPVRGDPLPVRPLRGRAVGARAGWRRRHQQRRALHGACRTTAR